MNQQERVKARHDINRRIKMIQNNLNKPDVPLNAKKDGRKRIAELIQQRKQISAYVREERLTNG